MGSLIDKGLVTNVGDDEPAYKLNIDEKKNTKRT